jgi:hypothetical protein
MYESVTLQLVPPPRFHPPNLSLDAEGDRLKSYGD